MLVIRRKMEWNKKTTAGETADEYNFTTTVGLTEEEAIRYIADFYGPINQLHQLEEECCELALEASHSAREKSMKIGLIEEVADVEIMIAQVKHLFSICEDDIKEVKEEKLQRQLDRIIKEVER